MYYNVLEVLGSLPLLPLLPLIFGLLQIARAVTGDEAHSSPSVAAQDQLRRHLQSVIEVAEIISRIGPQAEIGDIKKAIVGTCCRALDTAMVALYTIDAASGVIECECSDAIPEEVSYAFLTAFNDEIIDRERFAAWVATRDTLRSIDEDVLAAFLKHGVCTVAAAPIRTGVGVSGALAAFYSSEQLPDCCDLLIQAIAAQTAAAISHALTIDQLRIVLDDFAGENQELTEQASCDPLTGLPNRRALQSTLTDLSRRVSRNGEAVFSLVMVDVDHFKLFNDTHGHQQGDAILKTVAQVMSSSLRHGDTAARYGGEEFSIVLPGIGKAKAAAVADRIRRQIAEQSHSLSKITVSMGVAEFPGDGESPAQVIKAADDALYKAKRTGRNRVVLAGEDVPVVEAVELASHTENCDRSVLIVDLSGGTHAISKAAGSAFFRRVSVTHTDSVAHDIRRENYDAVLIDTETLDANCLHAVNQIVGLRPHLPIVVFVTECTMVQTNRLLRAGVADVLVKPCKPEELPFVVERNIERKHVEHNLVTQQCNSVLFQAIDALASVVEARDPHTVGHSQRVAAIATAIAQELGIDEDDRQALELAAKLHDVGKIALPDSAINKDSALTGAEWQAVREHPVIGERIVSAIESLAYVGTVIRHHHERLDGSGYPDGIAGAAIPYLARILAVADVYEAMTSDRAHRKSRSHEDAVNELQQCAGKFFAEEVVAALVKCLHQSENNRSIRKLA